MATVLGAFRSGNCYFLKPEPILRNRENLWLLEKISVVHKISLETYEKPCMHAAFYVNGKVCSCKRVAR